MTENVIERAKIIQEKCDCTEECAKKEYPYRNQVNWNEGQPGKYVDFIYIC